MLEPALSPRTEQRTFIPIYELEQQGESVKLTVIHESDKPDSKLIEAVSGGWPVILASLKSLLGNRRRDLDLETSRGDKTPLELFLAGVRGWESGLRRRMDARKVCAD